ncbi:Cytochrome C oxidase, cbb3-type, subunit III [Sulfobacillus thermosulfidooxidans DSM 9293]|uniref:Cytochrome C oxidase, cbb3-type, subunit III n=1 Tax=Sulfobacillus thermosulfidooxidans (strain DSM 9293 / VKM B-1269 / AT-1) TaxID=929705 RepID=A0A1W1W6E5_SULTA|nr:cytochrome c [Sulfobacillus thermosulfidooxidans]SMC01854.1 Cytochrome C oxidase, cbb3-type, subunit III [Sulfobacillus thermosulfidooxidans DSM 9293]
MKKSLVTLLVLSAIFSGFLGGCGSQSSSPAHQSNHGARKTESNTRHATKTVNRKVNNPSNGHTTTHNDASGVSLTQGAKLYASTCQSCHGKAGAGTSQGPKLAASPTVVSRFGTETALEAFIAHNMPATNPGSLSSSQSRNVSAYIWNLAKK